MRTPPGALTTGLRHRAIFTWPVAGDNRYMKYRIKPGGEARDDKGFAMIRTTDTPAPTGPAAPERV